MEKRERGKTTGLWVYEFLTPVHHMHKYHACSLSREELSWLLASVLGSSSPHSTRLRLLRVNNIRRVNSCDR